MERSFQAREVNKSEVLTSRDWKRLQNFGFDVATLTINGALSIIRSSVGYSQLRLAFKGVRIF